MRFPFPVVPEKLRLLHDLKGLVPVLTLRPMTAVYLLHGERILLLHRKGSRVAEGKWIGAAGGHMEPREIADPTACVLREMQEELALGPDALEGLALRYVTLRRAGTEIRQNYYFFARLKEEVSLRSNEGTLRWFSLEELETLEMPFSARYMMRHYLRTGRYDSMVYAGVADETTVHFTPMKG